MKHRHPAQLKCIILQTIIVFTMVGTFVGCANNKPIDNPATRLANPNESPRIYKRALITLESQPELTEDETKALRGMLHRPGYPPPSREAALNFLASRDEQLVKETVGFRLPQLQALQWRRRLCEIIAERNWTDLSPALVRAWTIPAAGWVDSEFDRPEYLALEKLHGKGNVIDAVFDILLTHNSVAEQGLRTSAWTLLNRLGERERLAGLLQNAAIADDDLMMQDLRAASDQLGIVPANREEILWIRELRQPKHDTFWQEAKVVAHNLPQEIKRDLVLRDLAILIAIAKHEPDLLRESRADLMQRVEGYLQTTKRHRATRGNAGYINTNNQTLREHRKKLTWGDAAAMLMAVRAMQVTQVVDHLFDYAERDRKDETTEYGGIIKLDSKNRFEVLEFLPRVRVNDRRFQAPEAMFNESYEAAFHFHFHAQDFDNAQYAGPGEGDLQYAEATRANCLVLTYVDEGVLNIDFYRHDDVVVDLGEIAK